LPFERREREKEIANTEKCMMMMILKKRNGQRNDDELEKEREIDEEEMQRYDQLGDHDNDDSESDDE
jgi:hypothetical protein